MNLEKAVRNINRSLNKKQPPTFSPIWIKYRCRISYEFIVNNIKNELGNPDWDLVVSMLDRWNQKYWMKGIKRRTVKLYEDKTELSAVLARYNDKLYTFLAQENKEDKAICDCISIRLVRLAQQGNVLAKEKITGLLKYTVSRWIECSKYLSVWNGYDDLIDRYINTCIRRFRYAGSFLGYLYRTLEYAGRGLAPLEKFSLDNVSKITGKRVIDSFCKRSCSQQDE